jgi:hypothetical protein
MLPIQHEERRTDAAVMADEMKLPWSTSLIGLIDGALKQIDFLPFTRLVVYRNFNLFEGPSNRAFPLMTATVIPRRSILVLVINSKASGRM